ncbi:MAG: GDP-mannose 4,6-dehydratase [Chloroflexota bacterium]
MRVLVTGAGGFVGRHLLAYLQQQPDISLYGTIAGEDQRESLIGLCPHLTVLDLRDSRLVRDLLEECQPDQIFHLAGQAFVPRSFEDPWETIDNNVHGTLNLLQAILTLKLSTRMLVVGSAEVYGAVQPDQIPLTEDAPFAPSSPYSVSKIAQDMLALQYTLAHRLFTVRVRPFNHIGPGQNRRFSVSNWALQIAEAEVGLRTPILHVGNLTAARDFTDVRDVVRAYAEVLTHGDSGGVYNVCSGKAYSMQSIMDTLLSLSKIPIDVQIATDRLRPVEIPILVGDYGRLHACTGWQPQIPLEQSLRDVLDEWRQYVTAQLTNSTP